MIARRAQQIFTALNQAATVEGFQRPVHLLVHLFGTWTSLTATFEATTDNVNWFPVALVPVATQVDAGLATTSSAVGAFQTKIPLACSAFRVRCSTFVSGTNPTASVRAAS